MSERCEKCLGKGTILITNADGEQAAHPCECQMANIKNQLWTHSLKISGIPKSYWDFTFDNYIKLPLVSNKFIL